MSTIPRPATPEGSTLRDLRIIRATALLPAATGGIEFVPGTTIDVRDGVIVAIARGAHHDEAAQHLDAQADPVVETIDAAGRVVMPGLINTHCHAAMTMLRGAAEDVTVAEWFNDLIWPMEVNLRPDDVYLGTLVAAAEMIRNGVTTVADHYFHMDRAAAAFVDSGMRADLGSAFFGSEGDEGFARAAAFTTSWQGAAGGRITTSVAPHAPYTCDDATLVRAGDLARQLGVRVHVHASEDIHQTRLSIEQRNLTPIEVLARTGILDAGAIIAHGNGIIGRDLPLLAAHRDRVGVTHGPKGYLRLALGPLTPIRELMALGVPVGYCTDGAASNGTLDIVENMRLTALTQKQAAEDARWFTSRTALEMAGRGSAAVLGMAGRIGELRVGARADLIVVDVSGLHCQPLHDLAAAIVHCVQPDDVRTVIIDGAVVMRERQLLTIDVEAVLAEFRERSQALTDRSHGRRIQDYTT